MGHLRTIPEPEGSKTVRGGPELHLWGQSAKDSILTLPLTSWVILGRLLSLSCLTHHGYKVRIITAPPG